MFPTTTLEDRSDLDKTITGQKEEFFVSQIWSIFSDVKKWVLTSQKFFWWKWPIRVRFQWFFFSTKVWTSKRKDLALYGHPTEWDTFGKLQNLTCFFQVFKRFINLNRKLRFAVEISGKKISTLKSSNSEVLLEKKIKIFGLELTNFERIFQRPLMWTSNRRFL